MSPTVPQKNLNAWQVLSLVWELGYTIAIPIVLFAFLGVYLDKKLNTLPLFLLLGILLATILSGLGIYRKIQKIIHPPSSNS